jgi:hypothetical protein
MKEKRVFSFSAVGSDKDFIESLKKQAKREGKNFSIMVITALKDKYTIEKGYSAVYKGH